MIRHQFIFGINDMPLLYKITDNNLLVDESD